MRRLAALLAAVALVLFAAGCGNDGDATPSTPLDAAVGYFAKDAPFVAAIETDPDGPQVEQLLSLVGRFPGALVLGTRLQNLARFRYVQWERDIRPQLGSPLVIGLARPAAGSGIPTALLVAMRVNHPLRAKQVLLREPGFRGSGKSSSVRIYENPPDQRFVAVDGNVVVAATNRDFLEQALAMKRSANRMRASDFSRDLKGLPQDGLVRVSADPRALLGADPRLRPALSVKWLAALRRLGAVVKAAPSGLTLDFHAATDRGSISADDLPLATKSGPVPLIGRRGELQLGVREPARLAKLAFELADAIAPKHMALLRALEPRGIALERQLPHHLAKPAALAVDPVSHAYAVRAGLIEAGDVQSALGQLAPALPSVAALFGIKGVGVATPEAGESFYALARPNGKTAVFGVVGDQLVAASDAGRVARLARLRVHQAPGTPSGGAVLTIDARELIGRVLARRLKGPVSLFAPFVAASLRDLTGYLTNSRDGLDGHFKLTVVKR